MKNKKLGLIAFVVLGLAAVFLQGAAESIRAQGVGAVIEAAYHVVMNTAGAAGWRVKVDSSNRLTAENLDTARPAVPLSDPKIDNATGGIRLAGYTALQLASLQSPATGYMVWRLGSYTLQAVQHEGGGIFVSTWGTGGTGSGLGAWTAY